MLKIIHKPSRIQIVLKGQKEQSRKFSNISLAFFRDSQKHADRRSLSAVNFREIVINLCAIERALSHSALFIGA